MSVNSSDSISNPIIQQGPKDNSKPDYLKAALFIAIATVAAAVFAALLVCSGGGVIIAGFMFSLGLAIDGAAILIGVIVLSIFAAFMLYETYRHSVKADKILHPQVPGSLPTGSA